MTDYVSPDMTDIRALIDTADGALDEETYEQKRKDDFDPPDDAEYSVTVSTIRKINDVFQALTGRKFLDWQTIDNAPKSTSILCRMESGRFRVLYQTDHGEGLMDTWRDPDDGTQAGWPTHWMALPAPPQ